MIFPRDPAELQQAPKFSKSRSFTLSAAATATSPIWATRWRSTRCSGTPDRGAGSDQFGSLSVDADLAAEPRVNTNVAARVTEIIARPTISIAAI